MFEGRQTELKQKTDQINFLASSPVRWAAAGRGVDQVWINSGRFRRKNAADYFEFLMVIFFYPLTFSLFFFVNFLFCSYCFNVAASFNAISAMVSRVSLRQYLKRQ